MKNTVEHKSDLIKSKLVIKGRLKAVYLVDGTKINMTWDEFNRPQLNIEATPVYTTED